MLSFPSRSHQISLPGKSRNNANAKNVLSSGVQNDVFSNISRVRFAGSGGDTYNSGINAGVKIKNAASYFSNLEVHGSIVDKSSQFHNALLSAGNAEVKAAFVDQSSHINKTNAKILCPELSFTLFDFSRHYKHKENLDGEHLTRTDLEPLQNQLEQLRKLETGKFTLKLKNAQEELQIAVNSNDSQIIKHHLAMARKHFFSVYESPDRNISLEARITGALGYIQCLQLLGSNRQAKEAQLKFMSNLAQNKDALLGYIEKQLKTDYEKNLLTEELLYIQQHGGENLEGIYAADRKLLHDGRLAINFLKGRERSKDFKGVYFYNQGDLKGINTEGADFTGADLSQLQLQNKNFNNANFTHANLSNANLSDSSIRNARFGYANCNGTNFSNADLTNSTTDEGICWQSQYAPVDIANANFTNANLTGVFLANTGARNTIFEGARSDRADINVWWKVEPFAFLRSQFTNKEIDPYIPANHRGINLKGLDLSNSGPAFRADFTGANLQNSKLRVHDHTIFDFANLENATILVIGTSYGNERPFCHTSFRHANLTNAKITKDNYEGTKVGFVARLGMRLGGGYSSVADFYNANLTNTDLRDCIVKDEYMGGLLGGIWAKFSDAKYYSSPPKLPQGLTTSELGIRKA